MVEGTGLAGLKGQPTALAAVDLGSNSFHLQVARVVDEQIYPLDSVKIPVRLGAGLGPDDVLDDETQERALQCLAMFRERLQGLPEHAVRAVGTNTLRVAKNSAEFLRAAQDALGFPIEVIAGREEARLIYLGVVHGLPLSDNTRLVVDIGGGSTECILGRGFEPVHTESLYMGCVSYSLNYFPGGKITKKLLREAELAARVELQGIEADYRREGWQEAIGASGTARALAEICLRSGNSEGEITRGGLDFIRSALLKAGDFRKLDLPGLKEERRAVIAGGFAIMAGLFEEMGIERMAVANGALREGVLQDMLGRLHHRDVREVTVDQFMRRYHVDLAQAKRVEATALAIFGEMQGAQGEAGEAGEAAHPLRWASRLHEVGLSIAHGGYHKHSAYILENADMPGFSRWEQARLALLARAQRGSLGKIAGLVPDLSVWAAVCALRLAVLLCRSRANIELPRMRISFGSGGIALAVEAGWLDANPLTQRALEDEVLHWRNVGFALDIQALP